MLALPDYHVLSSLYEGTHSLICRAVRKADNQPLILKLLKKDYPTPTELTHYQQEYQITRHLEPLAGVIKAYHLEKYKNTLMMGLEDVGGHSLKYWQTKRSLSLTEILAIIIQLTDIIGKVHDNNVIHKDIKPAHFIWNPATHQLKLIDFGIASQFSREETPQLKNPNVLEGTLAYISPEQTGRMNRAVDYRTDLYSLGVSCYELLTGQLPFNSDDPLELVHCQIAKNPQPALAVNPKVPPIVSDIIMKLMAKNVEERYQSAFGVKADLERCLQQLKTRKRVDSFELAQDDCSGQFHIPQQLYGRAQEIQTLWQALERVSQGASEILLVSGYAGIGKSRLVREIYQPITQRRGYFIAGKFDQLQRNVPYHAIVHALTDLVRQLLTENESQLARWREKLLAALGTNGQVIIELIPEIELIMGKQAPVPELSPAESQNRFNLVFQNFIRVFCQAAHPLVIFLDDLQWVDSATLMFLQEIVSNQELGYWLLIGAYRDNEVEPTHPLSLTLDKFHQQSIPINQIILTPLAIEPLNQLLADCLHHDIATVIPLAELMLQKTQGNPFFINELLKSLYQDNLLYFNLPTLERTQGQWQWELSKIQAVGHTDNVVALMIGKLRKLPAQTQHVLCLAACIGNRFDLNTLSLIHPQQPPTHQLYQYLLPAIQEGLLLPLSELETVGDDILHAQLIIAHWQFLHDRVQQAAYALVNEAQKSSLHLQIGRLLQQRTPAVALEEALFDIVSHFNNGLDEVDAPREQQAIAQLNLRAGQKAKAAAAYEVALTYLSKGLKLLTEHSWKTDYKLMFNLHVELIETAFVTGQLQYVITLIETVLQQAVTLLDQVTVYEQQVLLYCAENQLFEAIDTAQQVLKRLGITLVDSPPQQIDFEECYNLPTLTDLEKQAALRILVTMMSPAYAVSPTLFPTLVYTMVKLSLQYGNAPQSAFAYTLYGMLLCGKLNDIPAGYRAGQLALKLLDKLNAKSLQPVVQENFDSCVRPWNEHFRRSSDSYLASIQTGLELGNMSSACLNAMHYCAAQFIIGENLNDLHHRYERYLDLMQKKKQEWNLVYTKIWVQTALNLEGHSHNKYLLQGGYFNEIENIPLFIKENNGVCLLCVYLCKEQLAYLFKNQPLALENVHQASQYKENGLGMILSALHNFYDSLIHLAGYPNTTRETQNEYHQRVITNQKQLQHWAHHAAMNYQHKYDLVEAERARVLGQTLQAEAYYERAIQGARENQYIQEQALAYELAAAFYQERGMEQIAGTYLKEAHYAYQQWGALAKVKDLEAEYPNQLTSMAVEAQTITRTITTHSSHSKTTTTSDVLDLRSVIKASQTLSGEIVLSRLLEKMMRIVIENAGAEKGFLLLPQCDQWFIEAEGQIDAPLVAVLQSILLESNKPIAQSIIHYVARTKEAVVLSDATQTGYFTADPYIRSQGIKSVLSLPIMNQGQLTGILYLENNLTTGAFTPERLEILQLLSSQIAISIENARFYKKMADLNQAYERFVPREFLSLLDKQSVIEIQLGDQIEREMTVLFSDVRDFTAISEQMTPQENFNFINAYLSQMDPIIHQYHGFIDKYIGDAIMALFPISADDAVQAAIAMLKRLVEYNQDVFRPVSIGIGVNSGLLMLGTVGGENRMDGTVISDAVNLASRIEGMTKKYGTALLISEYTYAKLDNPTDYAIRSIDRVKVKGKSIPITVYEVFDGDLPNIFELKRKTLSHFEQGISYYRRREFVKALDCFSHVLYQHPYDKAAQLYQTRCEHWQKKGVPENWEGVEVLESK